MNNILAMMIAFGLVFYPFAAFAQDKKISYLDETQQAPFSGFLLSPDAYADMKFTYEEDRKLFQLKLDYEIQKAVLPWKLKFENEKDHNESYVKMCEDRLSAKNKTITFYESEIDKRSTPSFWESIDFPTGIVMGVTFTVLGLIAADKLDDNVFED